ncbi:unnamed protein product [Coregonus sp. 'balchen']|nr:unnamed protein product [Coregonus sp. 'balchen']
MMVLQSNRIREMQIELRELRQWTRLVCGKSDSHRPTKWDGIRGKREISRHGRQRQQCTDEDDYTLVKWALGQSLGEGMQVSGETVTVVTEGTYFIYNTTWTMVHVIKKRLHGIETSLMTCIQSMPSNITVAQNTCYTAVVHYLEQGSTLELSIPRKSAGFVLKPHTSFFGMFRI